VCERERECERECVGEATATPGGETRAPDDTPGRDPQPSTTPCTLNSKPETRNLAPNTRWRMDKMANKVEGLEFRVYPPPEATATAMATPEWERRAARVCVRERNRECV